MAAFVLRTSLDLVRTGVRERLRPEGRKDRRVGRGVSAGRGGLFSWLDVKLGLRMLAKHRGLTLVSTFALAVGIPVGLAPAHVVAGLMAPLTVPQGEEIRLLRQWSPGLGGAAPTTTHDFEVWSAALTSFESIAAFHRTTLNVDPREGTWTTCTRLPRFRDFLCRMSEMASSDYASGA